MEEEKMESPERPSVIQMATTARAAGRGMERTPRLWKTDLKFE